MLWFIENFTILVFFDGAQAGKNMLADIQSFNFHNYNYSLRHLHITYNDDRRR